MNMKQARTEGRARAEQYLAGVLQAKLPPKLVDARSVKWTGPRDQGLSFPIRRELEHAARGRWGELVRRLEHERDRVRVVFFALVLGSAAALGAGAAFAWRWFSGN